MNRPFLIPLLCAVFGFLFAWFIKPKEKSSIDPTNPLADHGKPPITSLEPSNRNSSSETPFNPLTHTQDGIPLPEELIQARTNIADTARNSLALKDHGHVQRLAELLELSIDQQKLLLALYQQKRDALNIYAPGKNINPNNLLEEAEVVEKRFNESLATLLDSEQIDKLNSYRKQQAANRAQASAQKEYADVLEKVDLSPEQQTSVFNALHQNASATQSQVLDKTGLYAETFDAMGFGSAGDAMSMAAAANGTIAQSSDKAAMMQALVESRKVESAKKIEALRPILSPAQMAQYSAILDARDQAFYTSMAPMLQAPVPPGAIEK
jgi:hypothetical protein